MLGENIVLHELVLCGCRVQAEGTRRLVVNLATRSMDLLDLSRNKIGDEGFEHLASQLTKGALIKRITNPGVTAIVTTLQSAKSLHTFDLSYKPLTAQNAFLLVNKLTLKSIKLVNLFMDNVGVDRELIKERAEVLSLSFRRKNVITHGTVSHNYILLTPDMREILLKHIDFLTAKGFKKAHLEIAEYFLQKKKTLDNMQPRKLIRDLKIAGTPVDEVLLIALSDMFPGSKLDKGGKNLDLAGITEIIKRLWPDKKPPSTPPETVQEFEQKIKHFVRFL